MNTIEEAIGGYFLGTVGQALLPLLLRESGVNDSIVDGIDGRLADLIETRAGRFPSPTSSDSSPQAFLVPEVENINNFDLIPVFKNNVSLRLGLTNDEGGNFGEYDIIAAVKNAYERPPQTLREVWGTGDLPSARVAPAPNGSWDRIIDIGPLPLGVYISYSWKVPRGSEPDDNFIASSAFIGPAFLAEDDASNSIAIDQAVQAGGNVEARFQLPDESAV